MISLKFLPWEKSLSFYVLILVFLFLFFCKLYTLIPNQLAYDAFGYYLYLPATFIYHDPGLKHPEVIQNLIGTYHTSSFFYQAHPALHGFMVMKFSMGWALLNLPFFLLAHGWALIFGYPIDGFSLPYQYFIGLGALLYTLIGLVFFRRILKTCFTEKVTALVIFLITLGTNYFQLNTDFNLLTHSYLFALYAVMIWYTLVWHRNQRFRYLVMVAISLAFIILTRPVDITAAFIPLFWGILSKQSLKEKAKLILKNLVQVSLALLILLGLVSLQLIYWKLVTGKFFYFSYTDPGAGFFEFLHPYFGKVLFSFRKGWLVYTPLAFFMIAGMFFMIRARYLSTAAILSYFLVHLYLTASWNYWWYAGNLGQRSLVQSYAILSIPLGFFLTWLMTRKTCLKTGFIVVFLTLVFFNLFQTWQYAHGLISSQRMTWKAYQSSFLRTTFRDEFCNDYIPDLHVDLKKELTLHAGNYTSRLLLQEGFENRTNRDKVTDSSPIPYEGNHAQLMDSTCPFSADIRLEPGHITEKEYAMFRVSIRVWATHDLVEQPVLIFGSFSHDKKDYYSNAVNSADQHPPLVPDQWNLLTLEFGTPAIFTQQVGIHLLCWYRGKEPVYIDDLRVEIFEPL